MDYIIENYYDIMAVCCCSDFLLYECCRRNGKCFFVWQLEAALLSIEMGWF